MDRWFPGATNLTGKLAPTQSGINNRWEGLCQRAREQSYIKVRVIHQRHLDDRDVIASCVREHANKWPGAGVTRITHGAIDRGSRESSRDVFVFSGNFVLVF